MSPRKLSHYVTARDGTRIAWHVHGEPGPDQPTILLTNGIGTTENFWRHVVADLSRDHRVVHWDYRGHGLSGLAGEDGYGLTTHAEDLALVSEAVMEHGGGVPPHQVGFSMGVAVLVELWRLRRDLAPTLTLIAGAPDAPYLPLLPLPLPALQRAIGLGLGALTPALPLVSPLVRAAFGSGLAYPVGRWSGVLQATAPRADVDLLMEGLRRMDPRAYWFTLRGLLEARGSDVLPTIDAPVLIIAAAKDRFMPLAQMRRLREALPKAEWLEVGEAGHGGLVEKGPDMAAALRRFLA